MKMTFRFLLAALLVLALAARAEETKHEIDHAMEEAMDRDSSTAGMVRAAAEAGEKWDKEMNLHYQTLKAKMQPAEWEALVAAQRAWIAFRDAQIKSLGATYSLMEGTMWRPVAALAVTDLTKQRALFLKSLDETVSER